MSKETKKEENRRPIKFFGVILPSLPYLILRLCGTFLRFKRNAKKARKSFKKELIKQGLDKQVASDLTEIYMDGSSVSKLIKNMNYF